jgi:hypothetical protein
MKKVVCKGCGWSWDLNDGGSDPYVCHKCGKDNTDHYRLKINISKEDQEYINESIKNGDVLIEDLGRWFKEKWVDVSKKIGGKHPPCGRSSSNGEKGRKGYPKCRPSKKVSKETPKVASSYDKKEKKAMTTQKRRAEKKDPKVGKGNKPTMTKFNENKVIFKLVVTEEQFKRLFENNEKTAVLIYEDEFGSVEPTNFASDSFLLNEDEYQGRKVKLGKIMQGDIKKFKVYVKNDKGKVVKVNFGFGGKSAKGKRMVIKKNNPKRRKSFRARHKCDNPGPRWKPRYWACKTW